MKPLILINFKTYEESTGKKALILAKTISQIKTDKYQLAISPQTIDLKEICSQVKLPVFAQSIDPITFGAHTGSLLPEAVKEARAKGTLVNHSEKKLKIKQIKEILDICKKLNLTSIVCAGSLSLIKKLTKLNPDYLAYEPKKWIGKNTSVTEANPKVIIKALKLLKKHSSKTQLLCGAGIHSKKDLQKALELGAEGVLLAHHIVKAKNPKKALNELLN